MAVDLSEVVSSGRAREFCALRATVMNFLYSTKPDNNKQNQILNDFVNSFSRFAGNQKTVFDNGGGPTYANGGNSLELKVERAFTQVLGRTLGRGGTSNFINALN